MKANPNLLFLRLPRIGPLAPLSCVPLRLLQRPRNLGDDPTKEISLHADRGGLVRLGGRLVAVLFVFVYQIVFLAAACFKAGLAGYVIALRDGFLEFLV